VNAEIIAGRTPPKKSKRRQQAIARSLAEMTKKDDADFE
jgi:hypothetical protein